MPEGYDLLGLMTGSEGLLGVVTEVTVRILRTPETARAALIGFPSSEDAGQCVADIIGAGIIPGGMEMMDRPAIHAAEDFVHAGYPRDVEALLIVELDGPQREVDALLTRVEQIAVANERRRPSASPRTRRSGSSSGPAARRPSRRSAASRPTITAWTAPSRARSCRRCCIACASFPRNTDCASPTSSMPATATSTRSSSMTPTRPDELERAEAFGADILRLCVEVGGVLTGEHGVGVEKRDLMPVMFNKDDLAQQERVKCAFDPKHLLNPGKVFPELHRCAELGRMHVHKGKVAFPDLPRF